jgi:hypothetical protein
MRNLIISFFYMLWFFYAVLAVVQSLRKQRSANKITPWKSMVQIQVLTKMHGK